MSDLGQKRAECLRLRRKWEASLEADPATSLPAFEAWWACQKELEDQALRARLRMLPWTPAARGGFPDMVRRGAPAVELFTLEGGDVIVSRKALARLLGAIVERHESMGAKAPPETPAGAWPLSTYTYTGPSFINAEKWAREWREWQAKLYAMAPETPFIPPFVPSWRYYQQAALAPKPQARVAPQPPLPAPPLPGPAFGPLTRGPRQGTFPAPPQPPEPPRLPRNIRVVSRFSDRTFHYLDDLCFIAERFMRHMALGREKEAGAMKKAFKGTLAGGWKTEDQQKNWLEILRLYCPMPDWVFDALNPYGGAAP